MKKIGASRSEGLYIGAKDWVGGGAMSKQYAISYHRSRLSLTAMTTSASVTSLEASRGDLER